MWVEVARLGFFAVGGAALFRLTLLRRLACSRYANALVAGHYGRAGFWGFVAAG